MQEFGCTNAEKRMIVSLFMEAGLTIHQLSANAALSPKQMDRGLKNLVRQRIIAVALDESGTARFSLLIAGEA